MIVATYFRNQMSVYKLIFWLNQDILLHWSYFSKFCILCNCLKRFRYHTTNTNTIQRSFLLKIKRTFICLSTVDHIELCSDDMFTKLIILCRIWGLHCAEREGNLVTVLIMSTTLNTLGHWLITEIMELFFHLW